MRGPTVSGNSLTTPRRSGAQAWTMHQTDKPQAGSYRGGQMLRLKVNYFTRGGIFGSAGFINAVFESVRDRFGKNRKTGARKLKGVEAGDLRVLRDLQRGVG